MFQRKAVVSLALIAAAAVIPFPVQAASNIDVRSRVVGIAGIMSVNMDLNVLVTRAEFAEMLVKASSFRENVTSVSNVSVFSDVPRENQYAVYIRVAAEQGWMTGYLGGQFRPEQQITLQEAVRALLGLLGYTNEDFTGDVAGARMSQYYFLELNEQVDRQPSELITRADCVNLFYNLLKATPKSGTGHYGSILDCELTEDGELNPVSMTENYVTGPKLVRKNHDLSDYVPFDVSEASIFLDGLPLAATENRSPAQQIHDEVDNGEIIVIYYNSAAKTIWAYSDHSDMDNGRCIASGEITNIYYNAADVMTPSAVLLENDNGVEYQLENAEMQFAFSIYGPLQVGDKVTLICEKTTNSNGDETYRVIDYIED